MLCDGWLLTSAGVHQGSPRRCQRQTRIRVLTRTLSCPSPVLPSRTPPPPPPVNVVLWYQAQKLVGPRKAKKVGTKKIKREAAGRGLQVLGD